ncbi:MAG: hypothetical protein RLZZ61_384 [Pseudomonadota bacterium]|jgi:hypothetical protein
MANEGGVQDLYPDARSLKACVAAPPPSEWFKINIVLDTKRENDVPFKKHSMEEITGKLTGDLAGCARRYSIVCRLTHLCCLMVICNLPK